MLFNPAVAGLEMDGCGEMIFKCITVLLLLFRNVK